MSTYTATISWKHEADGDFAKGQYSRAHEWAFDGGVTVPASPSPHVVPAPWSDPAAVDPEEAFVASLSSCHMLFFIDFARRDGLIVDSYVDKAEGVLEKRADGKIAMTRSHASPAGHLGRQCPRRDRHRRPPPPRARSLLHRQLSDYGSDNRTMKLGRLNHVGVATPSIEQSLELYRTMFNAEPHGPAFDLPAQGVRVCFVDTPNSQIELIEPLGETSPILKFLEKNPLGGQHHVCFEVPEIHAAKAEFEAKGARILGEPRIGAHGTLVFFVHPKDMGGVLTEIMETPNSAH